jgi:hypothetical protein
VTGIVEGLPSFDPRESVRAIVEAEGFQLNEEKRRVLGRRNRMRVTGVVVNRKANVTREYIRRIRWLIILLKAKGKRGASDHFLNHLDPRRHVRVNRSESLIVQVIRGRLAHVARVRGDEDILVKRLSDMLAEALDPGSTDDLAPLRKDWVGLLNEPNAQTRGYRLERFWSDLAKYFAIHISEPFAITGEQVDGAIELNGAVYLVECKSGKGEIQPKSIDALYGKLERRLDGTRGLFLALNGYSKGVGETMKEYKNKRIVLLDGEDVEAVLSRKCTLVGLLEGRLREMATRKLVLKDFK